MTIDLTDTTTGAIAEALTDARSRLGGAALGMVLTLVVETDEAAQYDAMRAANQAGREHPCRVLGVITRRPNAESRLDAEIRVGEGSPGETVLLRMYGPLGQHADSVVAPLLVPTRPYDASRDFTQIGTFVTTPNILVVNPSVPAKNLAELIVYAKGPGKGKLTYSSGGPGSCSAMPCLLSVSSNNTTV